MHRDQTGLFLILILILLVFSPVMPAADSGPVLRLLSWAEYIDPGLVKEFEQQQGVNIEIHYFESEDDRDHLLADRDGRGYDVLLLDDLHLYRHAHRGWIAALELADIPNIKYIDPQRLPYDDAGLLYGVPYFWGTAGIAYRKDLVTEPPHSWRELLEPAPELRGRIAMIRSARSLISIALKAQGYSLNTSDTQLLEQAGALLLRQKPYVKTYTYVTSSQNSLLLSGAIWISYLFNGDALMLRGYSDNIAFVMPEEGSEIWVDYLAIASSSAQPERAAAFINYLNQPDIAARNAAYVNYATPNKAAEALMPEDYLNNPVIYPGPGNLKRSELMRDLPARSEKRINEIGVQVLTD
jgi:spermidine/putrescine transport system substrate-binding protein